MNTITERRIEEKRDTAGQFMQPVSCPGRENLPEKPAPHAWLKPRDPFLSARSDNSRVADLVALSLAKPEKGRAVGVLKQAASDLRRFRTANNGVRRELYLDAYTWIHENDFSWPYSFVNVCNLLHLCPDTVRTELLSDASLNWVNYWIRRASRLFHKVRSFVVRAH
jgi:hypothetical protein